MFADLLFWGTVAFFVTLLAVSRDDPEALFVVAGAFLGRSFMLDFCSKQEEMSVAVTAVYKTDWVMLP